MSSLATFLVLHLYLMKDCVIPVDSRAPWCKVQTELAPSSRDAHLYPSTVRPVPSQPGHTVRLCLKNKQLPLPKKEKKVRLDSNGISWECGSVVGQTLASQRRGPRFRPQHCIEETKSRSGWGEAAFLHSIPCFEILMCEP